jgi:hypothetical protein
MDYGKPAFWIALGTGGVLVGGMSLVQQISTKKQGEEIRYKAVLRDFFIGAFLTTLIYVMLPESMDTWVSSATSAITSSVSKVSIGGAIDTAAAAATGGEIELQVGPARF